MQSDLTIKISDLPKPVRIEAVKLEQFAATLINQFRDPENDKSPFDLQIEYLEHCQARGGFNEHDQVFTIFVARKHGELVEVMLREAEDAFSLQDFSRTITVLDIILEPMIVTHSAYMSAPDQYMKGREDETFSMLCLADTIGRLGKVGVALISAHSRRSASPPLGMRPLPAIPPRATVSTLAETDSEELIAW